MAKSKKPKRTPDQIRKEITDKIVASIQKDLIPWRKPWSGATNTGHPCNFFSKRRYQGINTLILYLMGEFFGYDSKNWGTANCWNKNTGGHVIKGECATEVVYFNMVIKKNFETGEAETDKEGNQKKIPILRLFPVFNVDQIQPPDPVVMQKWKLETLQEKAETLGLKTNMTKEKLAQAIHDEAEKRLNKYRSVMLEQNQEPDYEPAERLIKACGVSLIHRGSKAVYDQFADRVTVPNKRTFESMGHYYETVFHELIHWTGHPSRLNRAEKKSGKYAEDYAFEELVAEMGACFMCAEVNIPHHDKMLEKSQAYLKGWLSKMGDDPKFLFDAASEASAAADYLLRFIGLGNDNEDQENAEAA